MKKATQSSQRFWILLALAVVGLHCGDSGHDLGNLLDGALGNTPDASAPDQPLASGGAVGTGGAIGNGGIVGSGGAGSGGVTSVAGGRGGNTGGTAASGGSGGGKYDGGLATGGFGSGGLAVTGGTGVGGAGRGGVTGNGGSGAGGRSVADAASDGKTDVALTTDAHDMEALCLRTGGQLGTGLVCLGVGDFPNSCLPGACAPEYSHTVVTCACPGPWGCFSPDIGCTSIDAGGTGGIGGAPGPGGGGAGGSGTGGTSSTGTSALCGETVCAAGDVCCGPPECGTCVNALSGAYCPTTCTAAACGPSAAPCQAGEVCLDLVHTASTTRTAVASCQPNPCGSQPLSCTCAASLCGTTTASCTLADDATGAIICSTS